MEKCIQTWNFGDLWANIRPSIISWQLVSFITGSHLNSLNILLLVVKSWMCLILFIYCFSMAWYWSACGRYNLVHFLLIFSYYLVISYYFHPWVGGLLLLFLFSPLSCWGPEQASKQLCGYLGAGQGQSTTSV